MLGLPDGSKVAVVGPDYPTHRHFNTGPVAGFLVDDVFAGTEELRSAGVEILLEPVVDDSGNAWVHFRAPDGNIYAFPPVRGLLSPAPLGLFGVSTAGQIQEGSRRRPWRLRTWQAGRAPRERRR
jgi:catechol 2,3-dioxygenase-like lactoylglutathione lyase family enzyme